MWTETNKTEEEREIISTNWTYMLNTAINNLHKCLWFGIIEERKKSLQMFEYQTGLQIKMNHINKNTKYQDPPNHVIMKIKKLIPLDLYIYEYAKQLFEWRWQMYLNGSLTRTYVSLPQTVYGCKSTSKYLRCI